MSNEESRSQARIEQKRRESTQERSTDEMAGLVAYSSSSEDESTTPPAKKRKLSTNSEKSEELPPLPAAFLDQYSSTVRTSAQDDPSLHGGRKRVTPHVQGNWPTHVYLECKFSFLLPLCNLFATSFEFVDLRSWWRRGPS